MCGSITHAKCNTVALREQATDPFHDPRRDVRDVVVGRRWQCVIPARAIGPLVPHALGDERVEMEVGVREATHPLNRGDRAGLGEGVSSGMRPLADDRA